MTPRDKVLKILQEEQDTYSDVRINDLVYDTYFGLGVVADVKKGKRENRYYILFQEGNEAFEHDYQSARLLKRNITLLKLEQEENDPYGPLTKYLRQPFLASQQFWYSCY